jgi:Domain of unknown function (DUF4265)
MAMAMRGESGFRRMAFALEVEDSWPSVSVETLWVTEAGEGKFRIDSIPFFVPDIAIGDLVAGEMDHENVLQFSRKLEEGGHSTIHAILTDDDTGPAIKEELKRGLRTGPCRVYNLLTLRDRRKERAMVLRDHGSRLAVTG